MSEIVQSDVESLKEQTVQSLAAGDWESVLQVIKQQHAYLSTNAASLPPAILRDMQTSTLALIQQSEVEKSRVAGELATIRQGRTATDVYRANSD